MHLHEQYQQMKTDHARMEALLKAGHNDFKKDDYHMPTRITACIDGAGHKWWDGQGTKTDLKIPSPFFQDYVDQNTHEGIYATLINMLQEVLMARSLDPYTKRWYSIGPPLENRIKNEIDMYNESHRK